MIKSKSPNPLIFGIEPLKMKRISLHILFIAMTSILCSLQVAATGQPRFYTLWMDFSSDSLLKMGNDYVFKQGQADSALICYSIVAHRERPDMGRQETLDIIEAQNGLWHVHFFFFYDFSRSYECLIKAMKLSNDINANKALIYMQFGDTYLENYTCGANPENLERAAEFYKLAISEAESTDAHNKNKVMLLSYINMLTALHNSANKGVAEQEFAMVRKAELQQSLMKNYAFLLHDGLDALHHQRYNDAIKAFRQQKTMLADTVSSYSARMVALSSIYEAEALAQSGLTRQARERILGVIAEAEKYNLIDVLLDTYALASKYSQDLNDDKEVIHWQNRLVATKDSMLNRQRLAFMDELGFLEDIYRMDSQYADMKHRNFVQMMVLVGGVLFVVLLVLLLLMLHRKNKLLREANESLYEKYMNSLQAPVVMMDADDSQAATDMPVTEEAETTSDEMQDAEVQNDDIVCELTSRIRQVMEDTDTICQSDFTVDRLTELVNSKYPYVLQAIKAGFGCNFSTLLNTYRMQEAARRLADFEHYGGMTIEGIANSVGVKSRTSFVSLFKKATGLTPSAFQRIARVKAE